MRYLLNPENAPILAWLLERDAEPSVLPTFPDNADKGLVVSQLLNGSCYAEVLPTPAQLKTACGPGIPLGRLFFHIDKEDLYAVCDSLDTDTFKGGAP